MALPEHEVVSPEAWLEARRRLLAREKELTRLRDQIAAERRALPWARVEQDYLFDGPDGQERLSDLFAGRGQLLVYHFMYPESWGKGCKSCSFWADGFNGIVVHLAARDVTMIAVSKASYGKIAAFQQRMGWTFKWMSSANNTFNRDYGVSFTDDEVSAQVKGYNFGTLPFGAEEAPGVSVFARGEDGGIYRTYSAYARGIDLLNPAYNYLDLVPKGRDEQGLPSPMAWLRHHDRY